MGKILYPIGTKVLIRSNTAMSVPATVVEYRKGKQFPYGLSRNNNSSVIDFTDGQAFHKWWSVKALKRYTGEKSQQETAKTPVNTLSADDVRKIVREETKNVLEVIAVGLAALNTTGSDILDKQYQLHVAMQYLTDQNAKTQYLVNVMNNKKVNEDA